MKITEEIGMTKIEESKLMETLTEAMKSSLERKESRDLPNMEVMGDTLTTWGLPVSRFKVSFEKDSRRVCFSFSTHSSLGISESDDFSFKRSLPVGIVPDEKEIRKFAEDALEMFEKWLERGGMRFIAPKMAHAERCSLARSAREVDKKTSRRI